MTEFQDDETLGVARAWLRAQVDNGGASCPCCTQFAKVYKRKINAGMARSLISLHRLSASSEWIHVPTALSARSREEGKLRYWGLLEEEKERREDGGRAGYWRVTDKGHQFALNRITVPKYAKVYDDRFRGLEGDPRSIIDALGDKFDYNELMGQI